MIKTDAATLQQLGKQAIDQLIAALEAGRSDQLKAYLAMLAQFHRYSWGNVLLIHAQFPSASHVAGYRAWQRLGRQVRRGARAIFILAPIVRRRPDPEEEIELRPRRVAGFTSASVFDRLSRESISCCQATIIRVPPRSKLAAVLSFFLVLFLSL